MNMACANDDDKSHYNEYSDITYSYAMKNKDKVEHNAGVVVIGGTQILTFLWTLLYCISKFKGKAENIEMEGTYEQLNTKQGAEYEEIVQTSCQTPNTNGVYPIVHSRLRDQITVSMISDTSMRHRFNPLYDAAISRQSLNTTSQKDTCKETQILIYVRCLGIMCLLFFAVAAASLAVAIYVLVTPGKIVVDTTDGAGVSSPQTGESKDKLGSNITDLQMAILELRKKIDLLNKNTSLDIYVIQTKLSNFTKQFSLALNAIRADWTNFSKSMDAQVANISKMAGPQGFPGPPGPQGNTGLVDYSKCLYTSVEKTLKLSVFASHSTDWSPEDGTMKNYTVVGADCSVEGGTSQNLETKRPPRIQDGRQYRCSCGGRIPSDVERKCILHLWICPRSAEVMP